MLVKWFFCWIFNIAVLLALQAQVIEQNEISIGLGYAYNIFDSPKDNIFKTDLIRNDYFQFIKNEFELSKKIKTSKHHLNLQTTWYAYSNYKVLNNSKVKLQYTLKRRFSKKLKVNLKAIYFKNKAYRTNILGERLRYAFHYQTFSVSPQLYYTFNKQNKIKFTYTYAPYFYFMDNTDYNYHKNKLDAAIDVQLKHIGYTKKKLKFSVDIDNRKYLYKISKNRLGKRLDESPFWKWTYYSASVDFFEEIDHQRTMQLTYHITWKEDNFEGYYNYLQQHLLFDYSYDFNDSNVLTFTADIGLRKFEHRILSNEQNLRYFYPEVSLQYSRIIKKKVTFTTILQTLGRKVNIEDLQTLSRSNYNNLFIEAQISYNFTKKN